MNFIYVKIKGMTCDHCKQKIKKELIKLPNIKNVIFEGYIAKVEYKDNIDKEKIVNSVINAGYFTNLETISLNKSDLIKQVKIIELITIIVIILTISFCLNKIFGYNIFNLIPNITSKTTYSMLFGIGVLTSIHCISMCGAINLVASSSSSKNYKKPLFYNLGRLISYTFIGGIVGLVGSVFKLNSYIQGVIIIFTSVVMFLMALNMMGTINFKISYKTPNIFKKIKLKSSFVIGLLNGLMPCGPLQAMQIYALSTGSFVYGALSMFLFCLGTIPLMLFMGIISNFLKNKHKDMVSKVSTVLILFLALIMFNRGLLQMGFNISNIFSNNYDSYIKSEIRDDYQYIEFDLSYSGYKDIVLQKDIPVKLIINASSKSLTGCNNAIRISKLNIVKNLEVGVNIIEFTPKKLGTYTYTCWMGMLKNNIVIVDNLSLFKK